MLRFSTLVTIVGAAMLMPGPLLAFSPASFPSFSDGLSCVKAVSQLSCHSSSSIDPDSFGTCCYNGALKAGFLESGLVLATQFWNTSEGPADSTTVHGLWPDYCNGQYPASCTEDSGIPTKSGSEIVQLLQRYDHSLLTYMRTYYGNDPSFWEHEYNKHGTCFTTLRAKCQLPQPFQNQTSAAVIGYFQQIVRQFRQLPTYEWLEQAGITPSTDKTYKRADMEAALAKKHGGKPYLGCINKTLFDEVWYYYNVRGPLIHGQVGGAGAGQRHGARMLTQSTCIAFMQYLPVDSTSTSSCNDDVQYREFAPFHGLSASFGFAAHFSAPLHAGNSTQIRLRRCT